jgi:hypothetical protein
MGKSWYIVIKVMKIRDLNKMCVMLYKLWGKKKMFYRFFILSFLCVLVTVCRM